jgi:hypothetical protein
MKEYEYHRNAPHSQSTNDLAEINECGKVMGDGKKCKESDYSMDEGPIHGGGNSSSGGSKKKGGMTY